MEWQLFEPGTVPEWTTPAWYARRDRAPHLEQGAHRARMDTAADLVKAAHAAGNAITAVDLGAGDGGLLSLLEYSGLITWGYDLQPSNIAGAAERGVDVRLGDVLTGPVDWGDIAIATEMLEHLVDPHAFVRRVAEHADVLIASSPAWETDECHYEYHAWAWDRAGYRALLERNGFDVVRHADAGGFQVVWGVR